ncbi:MAG: hypothetical protein IKO56_09830 [Alphaproteobacteria bacterium]|nr:hypothetical protein [Alphaproteobacteria bacterium]
MEEYEKQNLANDLCGRLAHSDTYYKLLVENNADIEQQMRKSSYDLLDCALKYVRDRMPKPTWDSVEKLKERGLAFDAPNN